MLTVKHLLRIISILSAGTTHFKILYYTPPLIEWSFSTQVVLNLCKERGLSLQVWTLSKENYSQTQNSAHYFQGLHNPEAIIPASLPKNPSVMSPQLPLQNSPLVTIPGWDCRLCLHTVAPVADLCLFAQLPSPPQGH